MEFAFTPEQQELRAQARALLSARLPLARVSELADGEAGWDPAVWDELVELGWLGVSVGEAHGGVGLGMVEEAILHEELGRACFPGPFFTTVALARELLAHDDALLAELAGGGCRWTVAEDPELVPDLLLAQRAVLVRDGALWLVAEGERTPRETLDATRRLGRLRVRDGEAEPLLDGPAAAAALARMHRRASVAAAAEAVGVAQHALDLGVEHARTRVQYRRPIGSFQAVSHQLADVLLHVELARSLTYWAAWCLEAGDERADVAASAAKALAGEVAVDACERSIQVHGGTGFTWEFPLHRLYKRALWLERFGGGGAARRAQVAAALLDGPAEALA